MVGAGRRSGARHASAPNRKMRFGEHVLFTSAHCAPVAPPRRAAGPAAQIISHSDMPARDSHLARAARGVLRLSEARRSRLCAAARAVARHRSGHRYQLLKIILELSVVRRAPRTALIDVSRGVPLGAHTACRPAMDYLATLVLAVLFAFLALVPSAAVCHRANARGGGQRCRQGWRCPQDARLDSTAVARYKRALSVDVGSPVLPRPCRR